MEWQQLRTLLLTAWSQFMAEDSSLLDENAHEQAVTGLFACHLRQIFRPFKFRVDVEYNRANSGQVRDTKKRSTGQSIKPDIIIHRQSEDKPPDNLLMLEFKKQGEPTDDATTKLADATSEAGGSRPFRYQFGLLVVVNTHGLVSGRLYEAEREPITLDQHLDNIVKEDVDSSSAPQQ